MAVSRSAQVRRAVRAIRKFHRLGRRVPPKVPQKEAYGEGVIARLAKRRRTNEDTIRKARAFADPATGYTPLELEELCGLIEAAQLGQDQKLPVFRPSHLIRLLSVHPKGLRKTLQRRAITDAWSTSRLEAEIAKRFGTRREGGRKQAPAKTLEDWLTHTEKLCESWRRWDARLDEVPGPHDESWVQRRDLPPHLREPVRRAADQVRRLHELVAAGLSERVPGHAPRPSLLDDPKARANRQK